ncbi:MAG: helix-turn-helix transcriptional regulator [Leptolyngbya sp. SIO1E4]|nr:helix-turn-helix transcriptional regulator [Leptolyngbya sp. SIO1E4]
MAIRFLNQASDYLHSGSPDDARLFHADSSDQIQIWSPQMGQGYTQTIPLQEGLSLVILDYTSYDTFLHSVQGLNQRLEYTFHMAGPTSGQSFASPHLGDSVFNVRQPQKRLFRVEIFFSPPSFMPHLQALIEHQLPQDQTTLYRWANWVHRYQYGYAAPSPQTALTQILNGITAVPTFLSPEQLLETLELQAFSRPWISMTPEMHQVVSQILSCPYSGRIRRTYLARKALELVALKLKALDQRRSLSYPLNSGDLDGIYQAAKILACHFNNPPSVEALARQVGLNRLKLNQGFHHVYGTTPFRYLRNCRLELAKHLLTTSDLAVEAVAHKVGYTSRSNFAIAFRQQFGLNPKTFQLYNRNWLQVQGLAS